MKSACGRLDWRICIFVCHCLLLAGRMLNSRPCGCSFIDRPILSVLEEAWDAPHPIHRAPPLLTLDQTGNSRVYVGRNQLDGLFHLMSSWCEGIDQWTLVVLRAASREGHLSLMECVAAKEAAHLLFMFQ
jgi:hypothetical protein